MFSKCRFHTVLFFPWLILACLWLAGCAQFSVSSDPPEALELERLLAGFSLSEEISSAAVPLEEQLLTVTPAMRKFVAAHVQAQASPHLKLRQILEALSDYEKDGIEYNAGVTLNAAEAFAYRKGNCLSLSAMVIALAREAGLQAYFNEIEMPPTAQMLNDNRIAFYKHVNAVVLLERKDAQVVELTEVEYEPGRQQRRISDEIALAQFHNNRAMELLAEQRYAEAFHHQRKAIALAPGDSYLWSNFGAIYSRLGHYPEAADAYRYAHHLDSSDVVAMSNLARVYQLTGDIESAKRYREAVSRVRAKNPFHLYIQAKDALNRDEPELALRYIKSAIRAQRNEPRFHRLAASIYRRLGEQEKMLGSLRRARELSAAIDREVTRQLATVR